MHGATIKNFRENSSSSYNHRFYSINGIPPFGFKAPFATHPSLFKSRDPPVYSTIYSEFGQSTYGKY